MSRSHCPPARPARANAPTAGRHRFHQPADWPATLASALADVVAAELGDGGGVAAPLVVGIHVDAQGIELFFHPERLPLGDALLGLRAPSHWDAIGVAAPATMHREHSSERGVAALVVPRVGVSACHLGGLGATDVTLAASVEGRLDDLCHRCLGLSTGPPEFGPHRVLVALWLDAMATDQAGGLRSFADLAARHPLASRIPGPIGTAADLVAGLAQLGPELVSWQWLDEVAQSRAAELGLADVEPGWFDTGSLARWIADETPRPTELLDSLHGHLDGACRSELARALAVLPGWRDDNPW
ncbi:MAG: hypothetical protein OEY23_22365 [Acidimicrobiia bacterium]|nr:hypothetical protein [Acidimicrobiia bacterium]